MCFIVFLFEITSSQVSLRDAQALVKAGDELEEVDETETKIGKEDKDTERYNERVLVCVFVYVSSAIKNK